MSSNTKVIGDVSKKPKRNRSNSNLSDDLRAVINRLPVFDSIDPPLDPRRSRGAGMDMGSGDEGTDG